MRKIYQKLKKRRSLRKARKRAKEKLDMEESNMEDEPNLILPSQDGTNDPHETTNNDALINTSDIDAGEFIDEEEAVTSTMKNIRAAIGKKFLLLHSVRICNHVTPATRESSADKGKWPSESQ